jgi:hypothetical protein
MVPVATVVLTDSACAMGATVVAAFAFIGQPSQLAQSHASCVQLEQSVAHSSHGHSHVPYPALRFDAPAAALNCSGTFPNLASALKLRAIACAEGPDGSSVIAVANLASRQSLADIHVSASMSALISAADFPVRLT